MMVTFNLYLLMALKESKEISFHSGSFDYTVYTMSYPLGDAESDGYGRESGVRLARGGKDVATVKCGGEAQENLGDLGWLQAVISP